MPRIGAQSMPSPRPVERTVTAQGSRARLRLFFRFPGGFIDLIPDEPGPRVLRWSDSDSVTLVFNDSDETYNGLSTCTLSSGSRTSIKPFLVT